jgi:TorA maturation chaperone TorD
MHTTASSNHVATIYRFCAQSMQYPDLDWFNEKYTDSLGLLLIELGALKEKEQLDSFYSQSKDILEDLQVEYTRLFINGVPHVAAPPYGSVYIDKTIRGKYSDEILMFYNEHGYSLNQNADLPDSLVQQLEFLSYLAEDNNQSTEEDFLTRFFLPWFTIFATIVKKDTQYPFYSIIISLIDFFTKEEKEYGV